MEFDITTIDKTLLVKALIAHSSPLRLGKAEYDTREKLGELVDTITDEECELALMEFNYSNDQPRGFRIFDYYKGQPIKLVFYRNRNARVLVSSDYYDARNGKYRFLEAMLNTFSLEEIKITKKGYRPLIFTDLPEHLVRPKTQENEFKLMLKNTLSTRYHLGRYWSFDTDKVVYKPPYMQY